jgi:alkylation response protein AidB-like acyl-CoA dehydrogenase
MDDLLLQPFVRLLEQVSDPGAVRRAEEGDHAEPIWPALLESGFVDALVDEQQGGAGLAPEAVAPLFVAAGQQLLPVAFAETVVTRALASAAGQSVPVDAPVLLWPMGRDSRLQSLLSPLAGEASHALVQRGRRAELRPLLSGKSERDGYGMIAAVLDDDSAALLEFDLAENTLLYWAAALTTAAMAGAANRVRELTLAHVNDRQQFGRPLFKFQAIQQQIAVMAERVATAAVAARIAVSQPMPGPGAAQAAIAKIAADEAATLVCAIAHAAHGAIGISAEHDLSLYTRRLKRWQSSFGSGSYWAQLLGQMRLDSGGRTTIDFLREQREEL